MTCKRVLHEFYMTALENVHECYQCPKKTQQKKRFNDCLFVPELYLELLSICFLTFC